ncbi:MAG: carbohydrate binding domain-containing protein [Clostridia bacterium]|nr:carbohydrate binding domain-containing protein [Clostridia bacterium]
MRKFKKVLSAMLAVLMLCVMMPIGTMVSAAGDVINKDFEDSNSFFSSDCSLEVVQDGGSKVLHWKSYEKDWANIYTYINVESGADYQVTFKMKASVASALTVKFLTADWMSTVSQTSGAVTTEWDTVDVTLNGGNGGTVVFMIQTGLAGSVGQEIYVDNVVVTKGDGSSEPETPDTPVTPGEPVLGETGFVVNGNFETGNSNGWNLYQKSKVDAIAAKTGSYGLYIEGNGGWGGLGQQVINGLEIGKVYKISLWYKALSAGVNIQLCEGSNNSGAKLAYIYGSNTQWTEFAVEFEATTSTVCFALVGSGTGTAEKMYMDDVSLTEVVLGGNDNDPNLKMIDTLMDNIKTQGRTALVRGTLMLDFTVSGIEFELDCAGDVYATFNASKISNSAAVGGVYFTIVVDGERKARDYCRIASVGENKILLAEGLSAGKHTFAIYRQSEHSYGEVGVCALSFDGEMLDKPADKDLYIEYIGDSISCGYGNLGNASQGDGSALWSDGTQAYTFIASQALNADWSTVSWSGLGCKYGYSDTTMQDVYPAQRYNYNKNTQYDFAKEPDVIVLALGTNDNSIQPNATLKRAGLVEMLQLVRAKNPNAPIVWIHGMMTNGVSSMIEDIVAEFGGADNGYYACRLTQNNAGGGSHPNLAGQQKFADELVAFLEANGLTEGNDTPDTPDTPVIPDEPVLSDDLITGGETSRMEDTKIGLGLAFQFKIAAQGVSVKKGAAYKRDITGATVTLADGKAYKLVDFGALVTNEMSIGLVANAFTVESVNNKNTKKVSAANLMTCDENSATYAVRIINIPEGESFTAIYARPYYVYEDEAGEQIMVYGDVVCDNYEGKFDFNDGSLEWAD